jgi:hypothetical protein
MTGYAGLGRAAPTGHALVEPEHGAPVRHRMCEIAPRTGVATPARVRKMGVPVDDAVQGGLIADEG